MPGRNREAVFLRAKAPGATPEDKDEFSRLVDSMWSDRLSMLARRDAWSEQFYQIERFRQPYGPWLHHAPLEFLHKLARRKHPNLFNQIVGGSHVRRVLRKRWLRGRD